MCVCLGEVAVEQQMDEETTTDNHNLLTLFPVAQSSLLTRFEHDGGLHHADFQLGLVIVGENLSTS